MRVVFMGTPEFAVPSLSSLISCGHDIVAVLTRPDAVSGRGSVRRPSAVKSAALAAGLDVLQPGTLRDPAELEALRTLAPDVLVVAAYGLILPPDVLRVPPLGAVNVHASLLPRWRGAAPVQRAILAGDTRTGVSIMRVEEGLDTGPYCCQIETEVGDSNAQDLIATLADLGAKALTEALEALLAGTAVWCDQDEALATYASKVTRDDVAVSPAGTKVEFVRRVRASSPAAACKISIADRVLTLVDAHEARMRVAAGQVASTKDAVVLGVADGSVEITELKPDGRGVMEATAWARGVRDLDGADWSGSA